MVDDFLIRFVLWLVTHTIFRIRIVGQENVPFRGPALLVANHMSHVDGFLIGACVQRFIRFMVWKPYYEMKALNWFFRKTKAIPVGGGRAAVEAIRAARSELAAGHVVCIFAEGAISRTGNILPFKRGMEKIMDGLENSAVPIIPGASGPPVGQHLQFRARPFLLEMAEAHSVSGDGFVRQSDAGEFYRA